MTTNQSASLVRQDEGLAMRSIVALWRQFRSVPCGHREVGSQERQR